MYHNPRQPHQIQKGSFPQSAYSKVSKRKPGFARKVFQPYLTNNAPPLPSTPAVQPTTHPLTSWGLEGTPAVSKEGITSIHIYDFDNTLFVTPVANHELFTGKALDILQNPTAIYNGGWWQDPRFLMATGNGWEAERQTAWEGWWNEDIVDLVRDSMADPTVLTILLTGRRKHLGPFIAQMCSAKGLAFDALILRGNRPFSNTLAFKINVMTELLEYYNLVTHFSIYEDRSWHSREFEKFLKEYQQAMRPNLDFNVILVSGLIKFLDPATEITLVKQAVHAHNQAYNQKLLTNPYIHRLRYSDIHLFTGYIIKSQCRAQLLQEYLRYITDVNLDAIKFHANAIVIRHMTVSKKDSAGLKYGKHYTWRATHFGHYNSELWAVKVEPAGPFKSRAEMPLVILAQRKRIAGSVFAAQITNWTPLENQIEFETQLGDWTVKKITKKFETKSN